jgi:hypothetical protein
VSQLPVVSSFKHATAASATAGFKFITAAWQYGVHQAVSSEQSGTAGLPPSTAQPGSTTVADRLYSLLLEHA